MAIYEYVSISCSTKAVERLEYINEKAIDGWRVVSTHLDISTGLPTVEVLFEREKKGE